MCQKNFEVVPWCMKNHLHLYCSKSCASKSHRYKGFKIPKEWSEKMASTKRQFWASPESKEARLKASQIQKQFLKNTPSAVKFWLSSPARKSGESNPSWKGGTYDKNRIIDMGRKFYRDWRKAVLERDDYQCTRCGSEHYLEVDHIKPYSLYPDLRFDINNGRVLCHSCHTLTGTYGNRFMNLKEATLRES